MNAVAVPDRLPSDPALLHALISGALGRISEDDWRVIAELAVDLMERVNARDPRRRFTLDDSLEVLARMGEVFVRKGIR